MSARSRTSKTSNAGEDASGNGKGPQVVVTDETVEDVSNPGQSCQVCRGPDTDRMVRCDTCLKWHHFECVGVTQDIENFDWNCSKCGAAALVPGTNPSPDDTLQEEAGTSGLQKTANTKQPAPIPTEYLLTPKHPPGVKKGPPAPKPQHKKPDGEGNRKGDPPVPKLKDPLKPDLTKKPLPKPLPKPMPKPLPQPLPKPFPKLKLKPPTPSETSRVSSRTAQALAKLKLQQLEEERALQAKMLEQERALQAKANELEKTYLAEKYKLLEEGIGSELGSVVSGIKSNVKSWVDDQNRSKASEFIPQAHSSGKSVPRLDNDNASADVFPLDDHISHISKEPSAIANDNLQSQGTDGQWQLTKRQLAARHAIPKQLTPFSGNPKDWPLFISAFYSTTSMCGFTNEENIYRLHRCLRGAAFSAVQSLLTHPSNVPKVISTLKMRFGQEEVIVLTLIEEISALPVIKEGQLHLLVDFAVQVQNFCATVDACGLEEYMYNVELLRRLVSKLPPTIKLNWGQYRITLPTTSLATFSEWLYPIAEAANAVTVSSSVDTKPERSESRSGKKAGAFLNAHTETSPSEVYAGKANSAANKKLNDACLVCKGTCKTIEKCKRFLEFSRDSRWSTVKESNLCRRCLRRHYGGCEAKPCGKDGCQIKHHPLLHNDEKRQPHTINSAKTQAMDTALSTNKELPSANAGTASLGCHTHQIKSSNTLFRYLPVVLKGKAGSIKTYAFLDDGSALTLLDEELANELGLEGTVKPLCLHWTGGTQRHEAESRVVDLGIAGGFQGAKQYDMKGVRTVNELLLPHQSLNIAELSNTHGYLHGLPIDSYEEIRPRILIGMKDQHLSLVLKSREGKPGQPLAVKTRLGWTICGGSLGDDTSSLVHSVFHVCSCENQWDESLAKAMKDYFSLDSIGIIRSADSLVSSEERRSTSLLQTLTNFNGSRFETGLLWRHDNVRLPDSRPMALRRFQCLERRMEKDPKLARILNQLIEEYLIKGYIRKLTDEELNQFLQRVWYLPVFPVTNPNKPDKIRMVWDAAAKALGISLNSALLKGPDQLVSLLTILILFRENAIGLTGDIREMFHQVLMRPVDQHCQRFFWRDENGQMVTYAMCVMTFGACCSPSSAQYVKNINADRFQQDYPDAVKVIQQQHYVDDMLISVETEDEAIRLAQQVKFVHSQGGFEIRNWTSNSHRVLESLREGNVQEKNLDLSPEMATEKVLGMWWSTASDVFTYKIGWDRYGRDLLEGRRCPTKRDVLRVLMTIFDPLGLIAHFLMYLKILLQDIWRTGIQWDDKIDDELFAKWRVWLRVLPQVENVKIPRCYRVRVTHNCTNIQLHVFVDASANGSAACCYLRFAENAVIECTLVAAKTRVSSLKLVSIPKLELQAAVIGTRLAKTVVASLSLKISKVFYWTDSRDVICWIHTDNRRLLPFFGFRVGEIREESTPEQWRWVPTKLNVADDATKWEKYPDMTPQSRWYNGPEFLRCPEAEWPQPIKTGNTTDVGLRSNIMTHSVKSNPLIDVTRFSTWKRLVRFAALLFRFIRYCRLKPQQRNLSATAEILGKAEEFLIRQAQYDVYADEIAALKTSDDTKKGISKSSPLYKYTPWIDDNGLLRMSGRIDACLYATADAKNPVILPPTHHTTNLIINHYHVKYNHQNHQTVLNELRQKYCVPRIRREFSKVRSKCQHCKNNRAVPNPPLMAQLPPVRLDAYAAPFTHVGIDYFGPMEVAIGRRVEKRWGMLVTCLTTRAIHIEVVHSLSTNSCIMGLSNFKSRRGTPRTIYSDRGTCFIGASRELQRNEALLNMDDVMKEFVTAETTWKFITPASPHMGGSWERMVGIVKKNLMTLRPNPRPNDEVLRNLLTEIEHTVNSRPLTDLEIDDESAPALTPNHFLLLSSNGSKPLSPPEVNGAYLGQSYKTSQKLANLFWKRWVNEFLPEITRRTKWHTNTKSIAVGDVVVIVDPKLPRNCWPIGRIIGTIPGTDNVVRSATVKTPAGGIYERAVVNLAVLDVRRE